LGACSLKTCKNRQYKKRHPKHRGINLLHLKRLSTQS
jgi:hypothetical protein